MMRNCRLLCLPFMLMFFAALAPRPVRAQVELSGQWRQKMQEDWPERSPGPHIGDYTGMPINDADRMRGDTWDAEKWVDGGAPMPAASFGLRAPRTRQIAHLVGHRPPDAGNQGVAPDDQLDAAAPGDLYGWTSASAGVGSAYLAGLFHRRMGRRRAEDHHHSPERGMGAGATAWHAAKRPP